MEERLKRYLELANTRPEDFCSRGYPRIILDPSDIVAFEQTDGREIGVRYESPYHLLVVDLVEDTDGRRFAYERFLAPCPGGAVVIIPRYRGVFILLKQYRHAMCSAQYGFPRGFAEPSLPAAENAVKELSEELGEPPVSVKRIGEVVADSGICGDRVQVFEAEMDRYKCEKEYEGILDTVLLTEMELTNWIAAGKINDGFTLAALQLLQSNP